jgi:lipoprotein-anchoring transpeptidase ErfK/SrfK
MAATALLALVATGGLVSAKTAARPKHLLALGSHTPAPPPIAVPTTPAASTTVARSTSTTDRVTTTTAAPVPKVVAIAPKRGAQDVTTGSRIIILLSGPVRPGAPMPTLVPPVAGKWSLEGPALTFIPSEGYVPWSTVRVYVPSALARAKHWSFNVGPPPTLRVQQLLAELHYLPVRFVPTTEGPMGGPPATGTTALAGSPTVASLVPSISQIGTFSWRYPAVPASLASLWSPGQDNILTVGAIMHFEDDADLTTDGLVQPQLWQALTHAIATRAVDPVPYDYVMVSENVPEQLVVWQNGKDVYTSPANTGVPGATTAPGTFPVYARFSATTMKGTDPDGYHYDVTGVPWVAYFNGGDAVHGYWRYAYGYPQSNGCVELPVDNAQVVWGMDPIGTLVTVSA